MGQELGRDWLCRSIPARPALLLAGRWQQASAGKWSAKLLARVVLLGEESRIREVKGLKGLERSRSRWAHGLPTA